jgi:hypothetical protein
LRFKKTNSNNKNGRKFKNTIFTFINPLYQIEEGAEVDGHAEDEVEHPVAAEKEDPEDFGDDAERERRVARQQNPTLRF